MAECIRTPRAKKKIKFHTLNEYLNFIDKSSSWKKEGFEWYCKFSPVLFYINENKKEIEIEGPHIIELCNELVKMKSDKGQKVRFITSEADWNFHISLNSEEFNVEDLKIQLAKWNNLIQDKINSQNLNVIVLKKQHSRIKEKHTTKINKIVGLVLVILFLVSIVLYF